MAAARPITRLSVSQLTGPAWCEYQYHYGLLTHARLPPEQRPTTLDLGHGQTLSLSRPALLRRARILAAGSAVHERLEHTAPQARVAATTAALVPLAVREVDKYAARCVQIASACALLRRSPGIAREVPVMGSVHGILVRGIIDEIAALPHRRSSAGAEASPYPPPLDGWTYQIRDSKTRRSPHMPPEVDQRGARMQCMLYKRLWDGLCLAALGHEQPLKLSQPASLQAEPVHEAPSPLAPDGGFDHNAEPLTVAAIKYAAGVEEQEGRLSATWCTALQPVLLAQADQAWAQQLSARLEARVAAEPQASELASASSTSPPASTDATSDHSSAMSESSSGSEAEEPDGALALQDVYDAMLVEVRLWMEHARSGADPLPNQKPAKPRRHRGPPKKTASRPDPPPAFAWTAIDPTLALMYRSRKRPRPRGNSPSSGSDSASETDTDSATSSEPTVERAGLPPKHRCKSAQEEEGPPAEGPPAEGLFGDVLSTLDEAIAQAQAEEQAKSDLHPPPAPVQGDFIPADPSAPDATLLGQVTFAHDGAVLEAFLQSMVRLWRRERYVQGVPLELTQRCNFCEFRDGCQWREGMSQEHLHAFLGQHPGYSPLISIEEEPERWRHQLLGVPPVQNNDSETGSPIDPVPEVVEPVSLPPTTAWGNGYVQEEPPAPGTEREETGLAGQDVVPLDQTLATWPPPAPASAPAPTSSSLSDAEQDLWLGGHSPSNSDWDAVENMLRQAETGRNGEMREAVSPAQDDGRGKSEAE